jgi:hypothetical protein
LVEQQRLGTGEQDARQLDPTPLAAGQGAQRLPEHALRQPQARGDRRGLALGGIAAGRLELLLEADVAPHGAVMGVRVGAGHLAFGLAHLAQHSVEAACRENAVVGQHVQVAGPGVLRQIADLARPRHLARGRPCLPGEHLGQRGLARPVAPDQADAVARRDAEGRGCEEQARSRAKLQAGGRDHRKSF